MTLAMFFGNFEASNGMPIRSALKIPYLLRAAHCETECSTELQKNLPNLQVLCEASSIQVPRG